MLTEVFKNGLKDYRGKTKCKTFIRRRKYEILFGSFLLMIFGDIFFPSQYLNSVRGILLFQNMMVGLVIFYGNKYLRVVLTILSIAHVILRILSTHLFLEGKIDFRSWMGITYLLYFLIISISVYRKVFKNGAVSSEMISAVLCGFILLCLIGTFLFYQIEVISHHSFSNLKEDRMSDLNYFSFATVLTIGYGDIVPLSLIAKKAVMFIGLTSHCYTVFVTGIIIGKYINNGKH